jgi:hypothetical protein
METIKRICGVCGDEYEPKRKTKKFCSDSCRLKAFKDEKKAAVVSAPVEEVLAIKQPWAPTQRESVLNKVLADSDFTLFKIICLAKKMESSALVDEIIAIAEHANHITFHNEVRQEVDGFDMIQRMYEWDAFEARTGLVVPHKKLPL